MLLTYFLISLVVLGLCLAGMAIGVIFGNKALKGSCGGLGQVMGDKCQFCENKDKCDKVSQQKKQA